jgi:hypothetical protein
MKMRTACTSKLSAVLPTSIHCKNLRMELTSIINHRESLKSVIHTSLGRASVTAYAVLNSQGRGNTNYSVA